MKKQKLFLAAGFMALCLTGCSLFAKMDPVEVTQSATATSVIAVEDGSVKQIIIDELDQSYYDGTELKQSINDTLLDYNSKNGGSITAEDVTVDANKSVRVVLNYKNAAEYADFNETTLFVGTLSEAAAAGYVIPNLIDEKGNVVDGGTASSLKEGKVLVTNEALDVYISGKIKYRSENVVLANDANYKASTVGEDVSYIVYK